MTHSSFTSEEDFSAAYDQYADVIFRHCYLRVLHREKAKELMMEAFTRLWQFISEGNFVDSMQLSLYRFSHQAIKEEKAMGTLHEQELSQEQDATPGLQLLQKVPAEDRSVLVLHYVDGFSLQEIGTILGGTLQDHALVLNKGTSLLTSLLSHAR